MPPDTCPNLNITSPDCIHGGFQDSNNCEKCKCPEGLGGTTCNDADDGHKGKKQAQNLLTIIPADQPLVLLILLLYLKECKDYRYYPLYLKVDSCLETFK